MRLCSATSAVGCALRCGMPEVTKSTSAGMITSQCSNGPLKRLRPRWRSSGRCANASSPAGSLSGSNRAPSRASCAHRYRLRGTLGTRRRAYLLRGPRRPDRGVLNRAPCRQRVAPGRGQPEDPRSLAIPRLAGAGQSLSGGRARPARRISSSTFGRPCHVDDRRSVAGRSENRIERPALAPRAGGTALVPDASSNASRTSTDVNE